jgi:hypothetical protein
MFETVTVDEALRKGKRNINIPALLIMLGIIGLSIYFVIAKDVSGWYAAGGIAAGFILGWLYWSLAVTKWRLWAFENVRNVHELKRRAIKDKLIWSDGSIWERTEIRSADDKQKLIELNNKFSRPDVFSDDFTVPGETIVYYSKVMALLQVIFMIALFFGGLYFVVYEHSYFIGALFSIVGAYFTYTGFSHYTNRSPQIIVGNKGIQTASVPFYSWGEIHGEDVITEQHGKSSTNYLIYNYPGGNEKLDINEFDMNVRELEKRLRIYRGRSEKSSARSQSY